MTVLGYILIIGGLVIVIAALPLWFWLSVLGAVCVTAGWFMLTGLRR